MVQYFVYLLRSQADGTYYIGQTLNINLRLDKHNKGEVISTKNKKPWKLVKFEIFPNRNTARWREYVLKHNSNERKKFYGE